MVNLRVASPDRAAYDDQIWIALFQSFPLTFANSSQGYAQGFRILPFQGIHELPILGVLIELNAFR
jgi:hypothetical protein